MNTLILAGGLPGSGKSSLAKLLRDGLYGSYDEPMAVAADDFFYVGAEEPLVSTRTYENPETIRGMDFVRYRVGRSLVNAPEHTYRFDSALIAHAHIWCVEQVRNEFARKRSTGVVVHNTFTQRWEMEPYLALARANGARVIVTRLYDGGCTDEELCARGEHSVPLDIIQKMRASWEENWGEGDPLPPWERPDSNPKSGATL